MLFEEAYNEFKIYATKRHKKQGFETLQRNFNLHILVYFKGKYIGELTTKDIIDWQNIIVEKNFSNSFNNSLYYAFNSFIKFCILNSYINENIVLKVGNFKRKYEKKDYDYYNLHEFRKYRKYLDNYIYKMFFTFMFFYGTRPSETLALKFSDLCRSYIYVHHNLQRRGKRELDTPKNMSSIRYLKLSLLMRFRIYKLRCLYIKLYGQCFDDYFIFGGIKPLSTTTLDRHKKIACDLANIREITQHQFRHSYATRMFRKKKPIDEISNNLGHSNIAMTLNVYVHTKKRVPKYPSYENFLFETLQRIFKKVSQSIITFFM